MAWDGRPFYVMRFIPGMDFAEEIRKYYETPAGNWGISMPALWLKDENAHDLDRAKALIEKYGSEEQIPENERREARFTLNAVRHAEVKAVNILT
mgnify:CR=1 FL=1